MAIFSGQYRIDGYLTSGDEEGIPVLEQIAETPNHAQVDLRPLCSPVEDQGTIGSCGANAIVGAVEYLMRAINGDHVDLSRLFVYYNARRMSDREHEDSGTSMIHAMASILAHGACPEAVWSYDTARWNLKPSKRAYASAIDLQNMHYGRVAPNDMRKAVLAAGLPIIFGMRVPEHLMMKIGTETGYMPAPKDGRWEEARGGHAMLMVGYDDERRGWIVRNSWGEGWGIGGHVLIDYDVMDYYGFDHGYWTIGPLDQNRFFRAGAQHRHIGAEQAGSAIGAEESSLITRRENLRGKLKSQMDEASESIRDRLRGPGAGGGYDKGPGAGGGYDKGPGAGGGYDRGPGAGGGYDD